MHRYAVRWIISALVISAVTAPSPLLAQTASPPRLVVVLVVDQMRADYVDRYGHQWTKGLRRLLDGGATFTQASFPYASTFTCVGHATISTGALPSTHGVIGNGWFDREAGRTVRCAEDASAETISYNLPVTGGSSAARLLVPTLADELRAQVPGQGRIATFSMKDRAAVMLAGSQADAVVWFNQSARGFATSTAYSKTPVAFVADLLKTAPIEADFDRPWVRSLPESRYLFTDEGVGEKPAKYWTKTFPHPVRIGDGTTAESYDAWETSPYSDAYLGRLGRAAVDALNLGRGPGVDLLGISFSALDLVGHDFGPTSHEVQDVLVRLDDTIGTLLDHLDRVVGKGNYLVALTADHGVAPIPEQVGTFGLNAGRLATATVTKAATEALQRAIGPGTYQVRLSNSELYLDAAVVSTLRARPAAVDAVVRELRSLPGVAKVYFADWLESHAAAGDVDARAALAAYVPGRSGDIVVLTKPYWFYVTDDGSEQPGSSTTHGSLYGYDQRVPLVLYGAHVKAGQFSRPVTPADIAPTLAHICGITLARADGAVLVEALAPPVPAPVRTPRR